MAVSFLIQATSHQPAAYSGCVLPLQSHLEKLERTPINELTSTPVSDRPSNQYASCDVSIQCWQADSSSDKMSRMMKLRVHLSLYGLYLAVAILITWPLVTVFTTHLAGYPFGDAHEMTRQFWWMSHALKTGQPLFFQPLLGYPDGINGIILWSNPLQFFPGWVFAFVLPLPAAYNLFVLLTLALNGWAMNWTLWRWTGDRWAALLGGLIFMAAPTIQGHLAGGHGGLLVQWPLPLLAYALLRLTRRESDGWRNLIVAAITLFLTPLGHTLQLIYAVLPLLAVIGAWCLWSRNWRGLERLALASALGIGLLLLFLLPVARATLGTAAYQDVGGSVAFSADLLAVVTPSFNHPLYGQLDYTHRVLGVNIVEGHSYLGLIPLLLALVALLRQPASRLWLGAAGLACLLSWGPLLKLFDQPLSLNIAGYSTYITLPWALLHDLPGFDLARTPGRFNFLLALALAIMAGYGAALLFGRMPRARLATLLLLSGLVLLDYQSFWPLPTTDARIPQAIHELRQRADVRAVFDLPWDNLLAAKDALWLQTAHQKPLIAGQVTRQTPVNPARLTLLQQTLDPALLRQAGADMVILYRFYDPDQQLYDRLVAAWGQPDYQDELLALFTVPVSETAPSFLSDVMAGETRTITDRTSFDLYAADAVWWSLTAQATSYQGERRVRLWLDDVPLLETMVADALTLTVPLSSPGYHRLTLELLPPCPLSSDAALICDHLTLTGMQVEWLGGGSFTPISFDRGLTLHGSRVKRMADGVEVALRWQFDQRIGDQDVRFIKLLDAEDQQVAGLDAPVGTHPAGRQWIETLILRTDAPLPPGDYRVVVGWYSYPDLVRFPVLSDVPGAADGLAQISAFNYP